jgi:hypothetical protein
MREFSRLDARFSERAPVVATDDEVLSRCQRTVEVVGEHVDG